MNTFNNCENHNFGLYSVKYLWRNIYDENVWLYSYKILLSCLPGIMAYKYHNGHGKVAIKKSFAHV